MADLLVPLADGLPTLSLLAEGLAAVPESLLQPPQNIKTLATWLYLSNGMTVEKQGPAGINGFAPAPAAAGCIRSSYMSQHLASKGLSRAFTTTAFTTSPTSATGGDATATWLAGWTVFY